jgi:hypothetical protein
MFWDVIDYAELTDCSNEFICRGCQLSLEIAEPEDAGFM